MYREKHKILVAVVFVAAVIFSCLAAGGCKKEEPVEKITPTGEETAVPQEKAVEEVTEEKVPEEKVPAEKVPEEVPPEKESDQDMFGQRSAGEYSAETGLQNSQ